MFTQYKLPYAYDAMEPYIDALTMETHHGKHHATYTANLNAAAEKAGVLDMDIETLLGSLEDVPKEHRTAIRNNGGGFYNHNLYFATMAPDGARAPEGRLAEKIDATFGSFEAMKEELTKLALGQFGSGWAWLSADKSGDLTLSNSLNQDNPISLGTGTVPIMCIDVWEHAYYLKYKNLRADYVKALFEVIDWKAVEANYNRVIAG
ncbi:MAG: superoxide dismutase [Lachnospiraceae bacterium]|nr:superoxide dismutase [Lachnospiraceae bacterium]